MSNSPHLINSTNSCRLHAKWEACFLDHVKSKFILLLFSSLCAFCVFHIFYLGSGTETKKKGKYIMLLTFLKCFKNIFNPSQQNKAWVFPWSFYVLWRSWEKARKKVSFKTHGQGPPWWSRAEDSMHSLPRAWVLSLAGKPRSYKLERCGQKYKIRKQNTWSGSTVFSEEK